MDTTATLDSFQLIVGFYLLYTAFKGSGTLYNFFDLPKERQDQVRRTLRIVYAICGVLALAEAVLCMATGSSDIPEKTVNLISLAFSGLIILILIGTFLYLRRLAKSEK